MAEEVSMSGTARQLGLIATSVAALIALSSCAPVQPRLAPPQRQDVTSAQSEGRATRSGGDLVMGMSADPDELDPTTSSSLYTRNVMSSMCEKLYDINAEGKIVPQLASAMPTVGDGGLTLRIPLRSGITFADGARFDAEAVRTTLNRHLNKKDSSRASEMGPVDKVVAVDERTVELQYKEPFSPITAALADRAGMILSPKALKSLGDDFASKPTCVGPFKFVKRVPATSIVLTKDPRYYAADEVKLNTITYRIMTDANIRAANLISGDVHVIDSVSPTSVEFVKRDPGARLLQVGSLGYQGVTLNIGNKDGAGQPARKLDTVVASDPRVRRAFEMAIDRTALVNSVFDNWFEPACSPISPDSAFATPQSNACQAYDPKGAQKLLREAGVKTPVQIALKVSNTPDGLRLAQAIQGSVAAGGFALKIEPVEYTTLLAAQTSGNFDALLLGWSGRVDPHGNTFAFLASQQAQNASGYSNPKVDALLSRAAREIKPSTRANLYGQVVTMVRKDNPIVYVYRQRNLTGYSTKIGGVSAYGDGVVRLSRAGFLTGATR